MSQIGMLMVMPCKNGCTYDKRNTKKCKVCGWSKSDELYLEECNLVIRCSRCKQYLVNSDWCKGKTLTELIRFLHDIRSEYGHQCGSHHE